MDDASGKSIALTISIFAGLLVIIVASGFLIRTAWAGSQKPPLPSQVSVDRDTVTAIGIGSPAPAVDQVIVNFLVETTGQTATQALLENEARVKDLVRNLGQAGGLQLVIQTGDVQLSSAPGKSQGNVYSVRTPVQIKLDSHSNLGTLIDQVVQVGAVQVEGVNYFPADPQAAQVEAEKAALQDARRKAARLAALEGRVLGPMLGMRELLPDPGVPQPVETDFRSPASEAIFNFVLQVTWALSPIEASSATPDIQTPTSAAETGIP